jgi:hypothetical protein
MSDTILTQIAYNPRQAAIATGRSRSRIFRAIQKKELVARKDGPRATIITHDELTRWVQTFPVCRTAAG